jgi:pyridoxamine 5'-phosphate oxidase
MIDFNNNSSLIPFNLFRAFYKLAITNKQKNIEAISISSFNKENDEVNSRYVNLKFIDNNEFIFFTNYNSPKAIEFKSHDQIAATIYWSSINVQIRIKAKIKKTSIEYNQKYFVARAPEKNALAMSSNQSKETDSYESVKEKHKKSLESDDLTKCPSFWGGYSFTPYYFEFWEGHNLRLNKRDVYKKVGNNWNHSLIQP